MTNSTSSSFSVLSCLKYEKRNIMHATSAITIPHTWTSPPAGPAWFLCSPSDSESSGFQKILLVDSGCPSIPESRAAVYRSQSSDRAPVYYPSNSEAPRELRWCCSPLPTLTLRWSSRPRCRISGWIEAARVLESWWQSSLHLAKARPLVVHLESPLRQRCCLHFQTCYG